MPGEVGAGETESGDKLFGSDQFFVMRGGGRGEPPTRASHYFMDVMSMRRLALCSETTLRK